MHVVSADPAGPSVTVKYNGLLSGTYIVKITSLETAIGIILSENELDVSATITSIDVTQGSTEGGTVLTITGTNFSDEPLDNPVKVGDNYCLVSFSGNSGIICRIENKVHVAGDAEVIVFLKTSEEATCNVAGGCTFTYVTPSAALTSINAAYDVSELGHVVTVTGSGFDTDLTLTELWIDGFLQNTLTVTSTEARFLVTDLYSTDSNSV